MAGNENIQAQVEGIATLLVMGDEIRKLNSLREFAFYSTNETHRLIAYHTSFLWQKKELIGPALLMQSGTAEIDIHSPLNQWVKFVIDKLQGSALKNKTNSISSDTKELVDVADSWPDELPDHLLWCPFVDQFENVSGGLILFRENAFTDSEVKMFSWLLSSYQHTWQSLTKSNVMPSLTRLKDKPHMIVLGIIILTILFFPIRLSVIGTGTVVPASPFLVNAPMQGIIKSIAVDPGQQVALGQLLFTMDKTDLQAGSDISEKELLLTKTKLRAVIDEGFTNKESNSEAPILESQLAIDQAHVDYTGKLLGEADVKSPIQGIVIFDNKEDWSGQPVRTGEKILVVADPHKVEVKITIPVTDSIRLEKDLGGEFFLYGELNPLDIRITTLGYNAKLMPNRVLAYQLKAAFANKSDIPQIGAEGTVKVYGHYVPFIYYLIRRPLQAMRQTLGI